MKAIGKFLKFIFWTVVVLVVLVVALVLALPLWIGPVVTTAANKTVPGIVKTDFHLGRFGLNPYVGRFTFGDLQLANPEGFPKGNCVELDTFKINLDVPTVWTKKIHIEEITLDGLVVSTTVTGANFKQIAANASGESEEIEAARAAGGETAAQRKEAEILEGQRVEAEKKSAEAPKVVIDRLILKNVVVWLNGVPIPVPPLTLEGIGADKEEGASLLDAGQEIVNKVMASVGALGGALGALGEGTLNVGLDATNAALDISTNALGSAMESIQNADYESATTAIATGADAVVETFKDAGETIKSSAKEIKQSAKDLKNLFKNKKK